VFGAISDVVTTLLGSAIGLVFMAIGLFSIPLSMLAVMHFTGWSWFGALVAILISACVPIIGQFGHLILALVGAYFLWGANFEWRKVAYPAPETFNISELSDSELDRFKSEVIRPGFEQLCKSNALKSSGFDGKLPEFIATRCECIAAEFSKRLTRGDLLAFEKPDKYSLEMQQHMKDQLQQACLNRG